MTDPKRPTHRAYLVNERGENADFLEIGAAWPNKDGKGFNIVLKSGLAVSGQITLREIDAKPKGEQDAPAAH